MTLRGVFRVILIASCGALALLGFIFPRPSLAAARRQEPDQPAEKRPSQDRKEDHEGKVAAPQKQDSDSNGATQASDSPYGFVSLGKNFLDDQKQI